VSAGSYNPRWLKADLAVGHWVVSAYPWDPVRDGRDSWAVVPSVSCTVDIVASVPGVGGGESGASRPVDMSVVSGLVSLVSGSGLLVYGRIAM